MESPGETSTPTKPLNTIPFSGAAAPPPAFPPDWASSMHAIFTGGANHPTAFFQPVWGPPHLMSPYGTPIAYSPMYNPGAVYAHPSMAQGLGYQSVDSSDLKAKGDLMKYEGEKGGSQSGEDTSHRSSRGSSTEDSSDTGNESTYPQENSKKRSCKDNLQEGDASHTSISTQRKRAPKLPVSAPGRTPLPGPATNLNIGMDIWNSPQPGAAPLKIRPNSVVSAVTGAGNNGVMAENHWVQDDRELRREKRKQSNRESARRSRLRKQQECDELSRKVSELNSENNALRMELEQLHKVCRDLEGENKFIAEELNTIRKDSSSIVKKFIIDSDTQISRSPAISAKINGKLQPGDNTDPSLR